jgi:hypothetical protein
MPIVTADPALGGPAVRSQDIEAAVILCGGLKASPFREAIRAPLLALPRSEERTSAQVWSEAFDRLGIDTDRRCILTDPEDVHPPADLRLRRIADSAPYRGPAGALRDAQKLLGLTGRCLIVESSRMLEAPDLLDDLVRTHDSRGDAVTVGTNPDGSFAGIYLATTDAIELIPGIGFMDIKEQWLPAAANSGYAVRPHTLSGYCHPVRDAAAYFAALARMGQFTDQDGPCVIAHRPPSPFAQRYGGSLIFHTARVSPEAVVAHGVVCDGAVVEAGAVVVRSILGPGARIPENGVAIDKVIPASDDGLRKAETDRTRSR